MNNLRLIYMYVGLAVLSVILLYDAMSLMLMLKGDSLRNKSYGTEHLVRVVSTDYLGGMLKSQSEQSIAIVVVIMGHKGIGKYQKAMLSISCYAKVHGYDIRVLNTSHYTNRCQQKNAYFQRHCVAAHILPFYDYILFLDADFGAVNPKRRIEEYIDPKVDIVFYDRFCNWEIMAGSYLAKNTTWSKDFLLSDLCSVVLSQKFSNQDICTEKASNFARYEERLPRSFHAKDNGALHAYVAEVVLGRNNTNLNWCLSIYNRSKDFHDLFLYEACIRSILGDDIYLGRMKILPKGTAWARDNWITNSLWSLERDFMIHGWKENQLKKYHSLPVPIASKSTALWYNPLGGSIDMSLCTPGNTSWLYDRNLLVAKNDIDRRLQYIAKDAEKRKAAVLRTLQSLRNITKK